MKNKLSSYNAACKQNEMGRVIADIIFKLVEKGHHFIIEYAELKSVLVESNSSKGTLIIKMNSYTIIFFLIVFNILQTGD